MLRWPAAAAPAMLTDHALGVELPGRLPRNSGLSVRSRPLERHCFERRLAACLSRCERARQARTRRQCICSRCNAIGSAWHSPLLLLPPLLLRLGCCHRAAAATALCCPRV